MSDWISAKDRLPEEDVDVLALNTFDGMAYSFCEVVHYESEDEQWRWFSRDGGRWVLRAFGYWMPLPEPPE